MKRFILFLLTWGWLANTHSQVIYSENFNTLGKGGKPAGWVVSSNTAADIYERPYQCGSDVGLVTPAVGKDAPSRFILPSITFDASSNIVRIRFKVFVLDANLKCATAKDFPCPTYVHVMLIKDSYNGGINSLPAASDIYSEQTYLIGIANGDNTIIFNDAGTNSIGNGNKYKIYFDFKTAVTSNCTSSGTKFIFDDFVVFKSICPGDCPPVANDDYFNASDQKFTNTVKGNVFGGFALWSSQVSSTYALKSLSIPPAVDEGLDYDNNNHNLTDMQFILVDSPIIVDQYGCSASENLTGTFVWNGDGTFEYTRAKPCVQQISFTYKIKDPTNLYSDTAKVTIDFPPNIILPVRITSFTAKRNSTVVTLKWETASEENNNGFYVQRNMGNEWANRCFVFSAAENGNSSTPLKYSFNDSNYNKGITQYRLIQVDKDARMSYSTIQLVAGLDESNLLKLTAFPNPSATGSISILFSDDVANYDARLFDISGRQVQYWNKVSSNPLTINHLDAGTYLLQVRNLNTGNNTSIKLTMLGK